MVVPSRICGGRWCWQKLCDLPSPVPLNHRERIGDMERSGAAFQDCVDDHRPTVTVISGNSPAVKLDLGADGLAESRYLGCRCQPPIKRLGSTRMRRDESRCCLYEGVICRHIGEPDSQTRLLRPGWPGDGHGQPERSEQAVVPGVYGHTPELGFI
jgi:hypothetical protein